MLGGVPSGNVQQRPGIFYDSVCPFEQKIRVNTVQAASGGTVSLTQSCNFLAGNSSSASGGSANGNLLGLDWLEDALGGGTNGSITLPDGFEWLDALSTEETIIAAACVAIGLMVAFS